MEADFSDISRIKGVNAFFIVNGDGTMLSQRFSLEKEAAAAKKLSKTIAACGNIYLAISPKRFKYAAFLRQDNTQVLIFPFGRLFLTVIVEAEGQSPGTDRIAKEICLILAKGKHK